MEGGEDGYQLVGLRFVEKAVEAVAVQERERRLVKVAKLDGAEVTAVDHGEKAEFLRSLGADRVIDYTTTDFTRSGEEYDLVLDAFAHRSVGACARAFSARLMRTAPGPSLHLCLTARQRRTESLITT